MSVKSYRLKGLDCANCAIKIQEKINELDDVESAELAFTTQKLRIKTKVDYNDEKISEKIKKIISGIESHVEVVEIDSQHKTHNDHDEKSSATIEILRLVISALLFTAGIIFKLPFWGELTLFVSSYLTAGIGVLSNAFKNIIRGQVFDENFLMSISTLGAFAINEFPEASAVMLFFKTGELLENLAVNRSRKSIKSLMDIRPDYAVIKTGSELVKVNPEEVHVGDTIVVRPGERIPLDGIVSEGSFYADTSALTGESLPRLVEKGDTVLSGFINKDSLVSIEVTKTFEQSTISKILDLVENASSKKARTENFITKFAKYYTPAVVAAALLVAVLPPILTGSMDFKLWINRALIFLVVSCPCALVISIPLSFFGGIGGASGRGILIKGSNYLEALNSINTVVFDKTGTLTKGYFKVTEITAENGFHKDMVLEFAALAEMYSSHPIAKSIVEAYGKKLDSSRIITYKEIPGLGIEAVIDNTTVLAGNLKLVGECTEKSISEPDGTSVYISINGKYAGCIQINDQIKEDSYETISKLKGPGNMRIAMLTGDNKSSASKVAKALGIDEFYYSLLPHQKVEALQKIKNSSGNSRLMFVGDGINDAPVLAMSDIGVAMGGLGSDAAIEAADIVLMTDEPSKIIEAMQVAKKTKKIVWQNIGFAFGIKIIVMILGAGGIATMWEAVFADVGVTLIAVFNSIRVMKNKTVAV
ncbi:MAG: heavy metal translocating P-type ATPase [Clostridia bacterium]|nr:heavy metal translocating P-type ATPase [Clostridia bacterium]